MERDDDLVLLGDADQTVSIGTIEPSQFPRPTGFLSEAENLSRLNPSLPPCQSSYPNFQVTRLCEAVGWGEELAQVEVETLEALVQGQA